MPHALSLVPSRHVSPRQHPPQFCGPHVVGWQAFPPALTPQVSSMALQFVHAPPPLPHADESKPGTQVLPWQQPLQLDALHEGWPSQVPPGGVALHEIPSAAQLVHCSPDRPHAVLSVPEAQTGPTQHPWQLCALHAAPVHVRDPSSHACPCDAQCVHACPAVPHSFGSLPARHCCPSQHPLAHVLALQVGTVLPHA
jgi:hypothetical protein